MAWIPSKNRGFDLFAGFFLREAKGITSKEAGNNRDSDSNSLQLSCENTTTTQENGSKRTAF